MKAINFSAKDEVVFEIIPDPTPGEGQVVIEVAASGICHTDIEVLRGNYGSSAFPVIPGHEYAGTVVEVGPGVSNLSAGDRVVVDPNFECGACRACHRGLAHLCENLGAYGVTVNGGFSELSLVNSSALHPIGDMAFHIAALAEPVGCVLNGVETARAGNADNALVFGGGPIGLLMAFTLRTCGVAEIAVVDIDEVRLELAESFGFKPIGSGSPELKRMHQSIDLVVDATGIPSVAKDLINYAANGGTCLFFGVCPHDAQISIAPFELFRRQLTLAGSHSLNHNIPEALKSIEASGPEIGHIVSHRIPLNEVAEVISGKTLRGSLKIQAVGTGNE